MFKWFISIQLQLSETNFQNMSFLQVELCCLYSWAQIHLTAQSRTELLEPMCIQLVYQSVYPQLHLQFEQTKAV